MLCEADAIRASREFHLEDWWCAATYTYETFNDQGLKDNIMDSVTFKSPRQTLHVVCKCSNTSLKEYSQCGLHIIRIFCIQLKLNMMFTCSRVIL